MGPQNLVRPAVLLTLLAGVPVGWDSGAPPPPRLAAHEPEGAAQARGRKLSHEETLSWIAEHKAWRRARKTKPIWARAVEPEEVGKGFQTADRAVETARAGYWLSVGVAEEPWFQPLEKIESKYEPAGEEVKRFPFDDKARKYRVFKPRAATRNWVARVEGPEIAGFFIRPNYDPDHPLYSPAGGYVVRDDVPDPYHARAGDVWLVQRGLFESTYEVLP